MKNTDNKVQTKTMYIKTHRSDYNEEIKAENTTEAYYYGDLGVLDYWVDLDPAIIQNLLRHTETSDPSIGRDQSDEYGIYYNA